MGKQEEKENNEMTDHQESMLLTRILSLYLNFLRCGILIHPALQCASD